MKRYIPPRPIVSVFVVLVFFSVGAQSPQLDPPRREASGAVNVDLHGSAGANYAIDGSTNLLNWVELFSGVATNGLFSIRHAAASNYPAFFYRGRSAADRLPAVTAGLKSNPDTAVISSMSRAAGSESLVGADGTLYTLTWPTNSLPDATLFTMTEVTKVTNLPFAGPLIGAVKIDPGNLALWGTASLEITFRTNVDRRKIASFMCRSDGSAFQLTPDRVLSNRVVIPITRGGVYGSSIVTAAELADAARRDIGAPTAPSFGDKKFAAAGAFDCQAAKKARAQQLQSQISAALATRSQAAAAKLAAERQNQQSGATDDSPSALAELVTDICNFYNSDVAPHWPETASNCAVGKVVTQFALSLARQLALLGNEDCIPISTIPFCPMFTNCLNEIEECCNAGNKGSAKVAEVLSLRRQDELLGTGCITPERAQEVIDACSSNVWTGSFSLNVNGYTNRTQSSASSRSIEIRSYLCTFEGSVIESTESGSPGSGYTIQLRVVGQISIKDIQSDSTETFGCNGVYHMQSDEVVVATNTEYAVSISTQPNGSYNLFEFNRTPTSFGVSGKETQIDLRITRSCDPKTPDAISNNTTRNDFTTVGNALPLYQGTWTDPKKISDQQTAEDPENDPALKFSAQWNFTRRTVGGP